MTHYMRFWLLIICLLSTFHISFAQQKPYNAIHSGINWFDQNNREVNAHGSCIIREGDKYYLFGEFKTDSANVFIGFSCYSSYDLMNWKFERMALPQQADGLLGPNRVGERPKVMKCPATGEFVMYMHTDDRGYRDPRVGYATSKTIDGEFEFHGALLFEGLPIRKWDMGTFQDTDGKGYLLIHHGIIYELSDDYRSAKRLVTSGQKAGESPAMFKSKGVYFWLSSNLTSWERNDNYYLTATSLEGPWTHRGLFAPGGTLTWNSQCSFVLPVTNGIDSMFVYTGDRWSFPKQGSAGTYVWQPITVDGHSMSIPEFQESWKIDFERADWKPVKLKTKAIKQSKTDGNWDMSRKALVSNEKGAVVTYKFKGRRVAIKGISNNTSGYARVIIRNNKNEAIINTIVDFYSKYEYTSQKFLSPLLRRDNYSISIEVMGEHGVWTNKRGDVFGSTDNYVIIEEVLVVN